MLIVYGGIVGKDVCKTDYYWRAINISYSSHRLVGELSIGDQQMVEIAKVLSFESKVIIMDEPTDALTDTETASLFNVIKELKKRKVAGLFISLTG